MSELILTGAPDPGVLEMGILAVKGDPGVVPLDQTNTFTAVQNFAAGITIPAASLPVSVISGLSSALTSYETVAGSTARVNSAVQTLLGGASAAYDTLGELQALLTGDESTAAALATLVGTKAPINNPTFTGTVVTPLITPAIDRSANLGTTALRFDTAFLTDLRTNTITGVVTHQAFGANQTPTTVKGFALQTADLQQWTDSASALLLRVTNSGQVSSAGLVQTAQLNLRANQSGAPVGGQEFHVGSTGSVLGFTRSGVQQIAAFGGSATAPLLALTAYASQSGDLQQWQNSAGTSLLRVDSNGSLYAPHGIYLTGANSGQNSTMWIDNNGANPPTISNLIDKIGLVIKGYSSQTVNLQEWQNSSGTALAYVNNTGAFGGTFLSSGANNLLGTTVGVGGNTTLGVVATTATRIALVVKGFTSQSSNLQEWQDSSGAVSLAVTSLGRVRNPNGTLVLEGTAGAANILMQAATTGSVPLVIKGLASQAGDLIQWQDNTGAVLASVSSRGVGYFGDIAALGVNSGIAIRGTSLDWRIYGDTGTTLKIGGTSAGGTFWEGSWAGNPANKFQSPTASSGSVVMLVKGAASQSANLQEWQDSSGALMARVAPSGLIQAVGGLSLGGALNSSSSGSFFGLTVASPFAATVVQVVKGIASQTANLTEWQDSGAVVKAAVDNNGSLRSRYLTDLSNNKAELDSGQTAIGWMLNNKVTTNIGLVVRSAASQSADPFQVQDSAGAMMAKVDSGANITAAGRVIAGSGAFDSGLGALYIRVNASNVGSTSMNANAALYTMPSTFQVHSSYATPEAKTALVIKGNASQSADLTQWQDSSGTGKAAVQSDGSIRIGGMNGAGGVVMSSTPSGPMVFSDSIRAANGMQTTSLYNVNVNSGSKIFLNNVVSVVYIANGETDGRSTLSVLAAATTPGDIQQWRNSASAVLSRVKPNGEYESAVAGNAASDAGGGTGGIVLKSPDGTRYRVTVANGGTLAVTAA